MLYNFPDFFPPFFFMSFSFFHYIEMYKSISVLFLLCLRVYGCASTVTHLLHAKLWSPLMEFKTINRSYGSMVWCSIVVLRGHLCCFCPFDWLSKMVVLSDANHVESCIKSGCQGRTKNANHVPFILKCLKLLLNY